MNDYSLPLGTHSHYDRRRKRTTHPFYTIDVSQRQRHLLINGKSGVGKSTAMNRFALHDITSGLGCFYIDPHGDDAEKLMERIPPWRRSDVIFFNPAEFPISFNVLGDVPKHREPLVASSVVDTVKIIWDMPNAPNVEMFVYTAVAALLESQDATLFGLYFILTNETYRKRIIRKLRDPVLIDFWTNFFEHHMTDKEQRDRTLSTLNKLITLIADPTIRNCIAQVKSAFNFSDIIEQRKIFIASLPQGDIGLEKVRIIVGFLFAYFHLAALQRGDDRTLFPVYINEAHNFINGTVSEALTGLRKFGISICLSIQNLSQIEDRRLRSGILASIDTLICFQVSPEDAEELAPVFANTTPDNLMAMPPQQALIQSRGSTIQLAMPEAAGKRYPSGPRKIRANSRTRYSRPAFAIEREIDDFLAAMTPKKRKTEKPLLPVEHDPLPWRAQET